MSDTGPVRGMRCDEDPLLKVCDSKDPGLPRLMHPHRGIWKEMKWMRWVWRNGGIEFVTGEWAELILEPFRHFTYVTAHSPTLPSLYLHHSSFSNPSFAFPSLQALHLRHLVNRPWFSRCLVGRKRGDIGTLSFFFCDATFHFMRDVIMWGSEDDDRHTA